MLQDYSVAIYGKKYRCSTLYINIQGNKTNIYPSNVKFIKPSTPCLRKK